MVPIKNPWIKSEERRGNPDKLAREIDRKLHTWLKNSCGRLRQIIDRADVDEEALLETASFPLTLGKGFTEGAPRQRALGEFWVGEEGLCRGLDRHSAKKSSRHGAGAWDGVFAEGRLRGPSAKNYSFLFWKIFAEGLQSWPSAKKCCRNVIFFKKNLCRGQWDGPRQRTLLCRGPWSLPLAKRQKFNLFFCFLHSINTSISYIYIYISTITYIYITQNPFSHN